MKVSKTYIVKYRPPFFAEGRLAKLHKCISDKRVRWYIEDEGKIVETNPDYAATLKRTM